MTGLFYPGYGRTWLKPAPAVDAADKAKYAVGHLAGFADVQPEFAVPAGGSPGDAAWTGLTNLP